MRTHLWFTAVLVSACSHDYINPGIPDAPIAHAHDDAPVEGPPTLQCDPATADDTTLCACMANIVCDQIYYCLPASELATKPSYWSPKSTCVESLQSDCLEDLGDPGLFPADVRGCVGDLATHSCSQFGDFMSVAANFPASCENLRSLDTGLGIQQD